MYVQYTLNSNRVSDRTLCHFYKRATEDLRRNHKCSQVPRRLLKSVIKYKHLGMLILYTTQCCSKTGEVVTYNSLILQALELLPGRAGCTKAEIKIKCFMSHRIVILTYYVTMYIANSNQKSII